MIALLKLFCVFANVSQVSDVAHGPLGHLSLSLFLSLSLSLSLSFLSELLLKSYVDL